MTQEFKLLSFLNSSDIGTYIQINEPLKELFPFTNDDNENYEFSVHARQVKDFLNRLSADKLISIRGSLSPFGSRANNKNYTLDNTPIFATLTTAGSDRLKSITPPPKQSFLRSLVLKDLWGFIGVVVAVIIGIIYYPFNCNDNKNQPKPQSASQKVKSKASNQLPLSQSDTLYKKK